MNSYSKSDAFFREQEIKIKNILDDVLNLRLTLDTGYKKTIELFFSSMGDTFTEIGNEELIRISKQYKDYIKSIDNMEDDQHVYFSNILKGIAEIKEQLDLLKSSCNLEDLDDNVKSSRLNCLKRNMLHSNNNRKNSTILILDDDKFMLSILRDAFENREYKVITTTDPYEAIEVILSRNISLALIDIVMPRLNGFEVFEILKENEIEVPVIFLTGKLITEYKVNALRKGVDDYITKPFDINEVVARAERAIIRSKTYRTRLIIDKLTGAYNKEFFREKVNEYKNNIDSFNKKASLAFMDIDDFKYINDTYGHVIGDYILKDYAEFMKSFLGPNDLLFRFGGDEFLILFFGEDEMYGFKRMEIIRESLQKNHFRYEELQESIRLTISAGITFINQEDSIEEILDRADKLLYKSKRLGKNRTLSYISTKNKYLLKKNIVILKDNYKDDSDIDILLKYVGYDVYKAYNAEQLINTMKKKKPELLILDLSLGIEETKSLFINISSKCINFSKIKTMLVVSEDQSEKVTKYIKLGVDEYIVRPFNISKLWERVNTLLKINV